MTEEEIEKLKKELQRRINDDGTTFKQLMDTRTALNRSIDLLKGNYYKDGVPIKDEDVIRQWLKGEIILTDVTGKAINFKDYEVTDEIKKTSMVS